jgi:hypothetical protein
MRTEANVAYMNVSKVMLYFLEKQPYEQVEPVWKSYRKFVYLFFSISTPTTLNVLYNISSLC